MKLIIFRHGETDGNVRNIVQGAGIDCPLNETGKKQAALLRDRPGVRKAAGNLLLAPLPCA